MMFNNENITIEQAVSKAKKATKKGNIQLAIDIYETILKSHPKHPIAKKNLKKLKNKILVNSPHKNKKNIPPQTQIDKLICLFQSKQFLEAEQMCNQLLELYPSSLTVINIRGIIHQAQGQLESALIFFNKAISINPFYPEAYINRGNILKEQRNLEDAIANYKKAISINQDFTEAHSNLGNALQQQGKFAAAITSYDRAILLKPDYAEAYYNRANALKSLHQYDAALLSYDKAISINPMYAEAYNNRGNLFEAREELNNASICYQKAISIRPAYFEALNNLGNLLQTQGHFDAALIKFSEAIKINPEYAQAYYNRGKTYESLNDLESALSNYKKAIHIQPNFPEAYNNLGTVHEVHDRINEAIKNYRKAITLKPDFAEAYNNLGNSYETLGHLDAAIESYQKATYLKPEYSQVYDNLCELLEKNNRHVELKKIVLQAQKTLATDDPYLQLRLAQIAIHEKRYGDARQYLETIEAEKLSLKAQKLCAELLGKTYDRLKQFPDAFRQFERSNDIAEKSITNHEINAQRYFSSVTQLSNLWSKVGKISWPCKQLSKSPYSLAFLIGFPRSGTTLLDTIFRSHPDITVIEEKPMVEYMLSAINIQPVSPNFLDSINDKEIMHLKKLYDEKLRYYVGDEEINGKVIIDKYPLNIKHVGLIHRIFPNAKFILALRHPNDCILSCFMQNFKLNDAMANFLSINQSAELYNAIMKLWSHYQNTLNLMVGTIHYEDLIQDLEKTLKPLLKFLDLKWHDNLHNYQQTALTRGKISTPSYNQVTQKLYQRASGRWKNYEDELANIFPLTQQWVKAFGYSITADSKHDHTLKKSTITPTNRVILKPSLPNDF